MIPAHFVELAALPLTPNGKLDRNALPMPEDQSQSRGEYVAPRTATEALLAEIWAEVLGLERVGIHDNFFELGGHSLLTMKIVAQIFERTQLSLPVWTIFQLPSIAALAQSMEQPSAEEYTEGVL
jgi:acyl carrier protein